MQSYRYGQVNGTYGKRTRYCHIGHPPVREDLPAEALRGKQKKIEFVIEGF